MAPISDIEAASLIAQYGITDSTVSDDQWTVTSTLGNGGTLIQHRNPAEFTGYEYVDAAPVVEAPAPAPVVEAPAEAEPPLDPAAPVA